MPKHCQLLVSQPVQTQQGNIALEVHGSMKAVVSAIHAQRLYAVSAPHYSSPPTRTNRPDSALQCAWSMLPPEPEILLVEDTKQDARCGLPVPPPGVTGTTQGAQLRNRLVISGIAAVMRAARARCSPTPHDVCHNAGTYTYYVLPRFAYERSLQACR